MPKRITALLVALLSIATGLAATTMTAGAVVPGVVDVAVQIEAKPSIVSPPGAYALYAVEASNVGLVAVSGATVTVALPAGSFYDDTLSTPACSGTPTTVTCPTGPLAVGATVPFDVVASTPASVGSVTATATIVEEDVLLEPLEYQGNNTGTTTVDVRVADGTGASALVRENESITLDVGDGRRYVLRVPAGVPGVIVSIEPDDGADKLCGLSGCGEGFLTTFEPHPVFKAEDPANPLFTSKTFGLQPPCRGLGGDCTEIYYAKDDLTPILVEMPECATPGTAAPSPCVDDKYKTGGTTWFDVLMLSNDPLEVPPLLLGR